MVTQARRGIAIETPLGKDVLLLRSFSGREELGRMFEFELDLLSENYSIPFDEIVGRNVTLRLNLVDGNIRYFNGFIRRFVQVAPMSRYAQYRATMTPWLWFLTRTADCRIFQNKTVPDIIKELFKQRGFCDMEDTLDAANYRTWEYCVQYRETDFNFVSRLMEQEGIYYYFKHEQGTHTLVLCDSLSKHNPLEFYDPWENAYRNQIPFRSHGTHVVIPEHISDWTLQQEVQPGVYAHTDYNFNKPKTPLLNPSSMQRNHARADYEVFDYPGEFGENSEGERYARVRMEELHAQCEIRQGQTDARVIRPGYTLAILDYPREDQNKKPLLITSAQYRIATSEFESSKGGPVDTSDICSCSFTAIDAATQFRPVRMASKPVVQGTQTAIVVGPAGKEIYTDPYGRVKVQFHWDRYGEANENSSCWIRVSQAHAGKRFGGIDLPRIGEEVIVSFLEGDPDRPIITGRVYNAESMPPYELPAHKTMSTLKSLSSIGGGGFNELRFEDKKGDEQVFLHAEKNLDIRVKNNAYETICNDLHVDVKKDQYEHVENNRQVVVDADHLEKIGKDRHLKVTGKEAKEVGDSLSLSVTGDVIEAFKANHSEQVANAYYLKGMNLVIEGMTNLTLKVGGNFVVLDPGGVYINGNLVMINSGGAAGAGNAGSVVPPAAATAALEADTAKPGEMTKPIAVPIKPHKPPQTKEEKKKKKSWIEIELVGEDGSPIPGETYQITLPDGSVAEGTLDDKGLAKVSGIDPGNCQITFPNLDKEAWERI